jgi:hypothetical protein
MLIDPGFVSKCQERTTWQRKLHIPTSPLIPCPCHRKSPLTGDMSRSASSAWVSSYRNRIFSTINYYLLTECSGCRWAGGVRDPPGLWQLLRNNQDGWREFQEPHFSTRGFHHDNPNRLGSMRTRGGFLIDEDARLFDPSVFGITGREVETMDPSQRKLLEVG